MIQRCLLFVVVCLLVSACQSPPAAVDTPESLAANTLPPLPELTSQPTPAEWVEQELYGISLGIEKPSGWEVEKTTDGILLAEHFGTMAASSTSGIQIHIFLHAAMNFNVPPGENAAYSILRQIVRTPSYIGSARVNDPYGFQWGGHDAAFYLSNNGDGNMTMLLALSIPGFDYMVVCNVTSPAREAGRIREVLPMILDTLTVNGVRLDGEALRRLPDPLVFPPYTHGDGN